MRRATAWFDHAVTALIVATLLSELAVVLANVIARSLFQTSLLWIDEITGIALAILAFVGGAAAYGRGGLLSVQFFVQRLGVNAQAAAGALFDWLVLAISAIVGVASIPMLQTQWQSKTPFLHVSTAFTIAPVTLGAVLTALYAARHLMRRYERPRVVWLTGAALFLAGSLAVVTQGWWVPSFRGPLALEVMLGIFALLIAFGLPVGYALAAGSIVYIYGARPATMTALPSHMLGGVANFLLLALPFFIFAGFIMERGGISSRLVDFMRAVVGHIRGGLLQAMVLAMYLVSGMSGSKSGDVAAVGTSMNEMLAREGYLPEENVAVLAASAVMGETVPPSLAMLVLGTITTVSVGSLFIAGIVPAAVIGAVLLFAVYVRARLQGRVPASRFSWGLLGRTGLRAIPPLLMLVILFGGILSGIGTPTEVSSFAVTYGLFLATVVYRATGVRALVRAVTEAALMTGMILFIVANAIAFSWVLTVAELPQGLVAWLEAAHLGQAGFMLFSIVLLIVMGALLEGIGSLLILGPLLVPVAAKIGLDPLHYAIVLIIAMGIGAFSPPLGVGFYISCSIGKARVEDAMRVVPQLLGVVFAGLLIVAFVPWFTLALPHAVGIR